MDTFTIHVFTHRLGRVAERVVCRSLGTKRARRKRSPQTSVEDSITVLLGSATESSFFVRKQIWPPNLFATSFNRFPSLQAFAVCGIHRQAVITFPGGVGKLGVVTTDKRSRGRGEAREGWWMIFRGLKFSISGRSHNRRLWFLISGLLFGKYKAI